MPSVLPSLGDLAILALTLLLPAAPRAAVVSTYTPPPDPGPNPACPSDTRLVVGRHFADVEHLCVDWNLPAQRCWSYYQDFTIAHGEPSPVRVCMDQYEAPNKRGARPLVMRTYPEAAGWCRAHHKRICAEAEWETACESGDERPWFYGWSLDSAVCNTNKSWRKFDAEALMAGGDVAIKETERLWQGSPSGDFEACRTADGVYDLMGNVEEWVSSSRRRRYPAALMGGFWAKPWVGCRGTNDAHEPTHFLFYEVGFRCCADPKDPPDAGADGG